jgi:GNAT superfamily N-acetyltransferase
MLDPLFGIESRKLSPMVAPDDAKQRVKDAGIEGQVPLNQYPSGMRSDTLQILIDANVAKMRRQTIIQQADGWAPQLGGMLVGSLIDPVNVASAFIPVVGEARYAQLLARAGGTLGRTGIRLGVGAAEGAVGAAVVEPLIYAGQQQWRNDYDAYDSLLNIAGGAGFGALLHGSAGLAKDVFGRPIAPELPRRTEAAVETVPRADEIAPVAAPVGAEPVARPMQAIPDEFIAKTKGGEWRLSDKAAAGGRDFSEFGQIREVVAYDGEKQIGSLLYANDGTPPTIEVDPAYQRKGVATSMLKLAKERGGVLGDAQTGVAGRERPVYRTDEGHAFRAAADESTVELAPRMGEAAPAPKLDPGIFGDGIVRPFVAELDPQTQVNALRQAVAQDAQGRPIDVTPAMLADPKFQADPAAHQESMARAVANSQQMASADSQASIVAEQKIAETPQKASALEQAKQALADDEARYRDGGGDPAAVEADEGDSKMIRDAVKAATLCMMRSGA